MITVRNIIYLIILFGTAFLSVMYGNAKKRNIVFHEMNLNPECGEKSLLTVFFISDIHRRKIDNKLLNEIDQQVDVVIVGGDLAERGVPYSRILKNVKNLSNLGPVYFIWGNNDREAGEAAIRQIFAACGGQILDNESTPIPGHSKWGIFGTDDPSSRNVDIDATFQEINAYEKTIFIAHNPSVFRKVEPFFQPDLMLAGHTHGGQIRLGKLGLFEKGSFKLKKNRAQLVSNGFGTSTLPLRFGAVSECHVIEIYYKESAF